MRLYGLDFNADDVALVEAEMYRHGGYMEVKGKRYGEGPLHHFRALITALCPWFKWQVYSDMIVDAWVNNVNIGIMGPASTGKTFTAAMCAYAEFFCWPTGTSIIMSSTTLEGLRLRVWGAITEILGQVQERRPWAPGVLVPSERRIYPHQPNEDELRDPRDAIMGIACRVGDTFVGISGYVGLKNQRVYGIFDEASLMPGAFWDSTSNLRKNPRVKFMAMGNPKDPTDALGRICEPHKDLGGWDSLPYSEKSRTWRARGENSIAVQLSGLDTPNGKYEKGINPYPYLITLEQIADDAERYGKDSWQYQMMNLGVMPKHASAKRVITRAMCERGRAFEEPIWDGDAKMTDYVGVDAAYSGVGGDRTPLIRLRTGKDMATGKSIIATVDGPIIIQVNLGKKDKEGRTIPAEEQIAEFVMNYCQTHDIPPDNVGFDSTGRGSLVSAFARLWSAKVEAIEFGGLPPEDRRVWGHDEKTEREAYGKMVTALWFAARNAIVTGQTRGFPTSVFEEGMLREFTITKAGKEDVEPKEKTRERLGRSPDLMDGYVSGLEVARRRGFMIGIDTPLVNGKTPKWIEKRSNNYRELLQSKECLV